MDKNFIINLKEYGFDEHGIARGYYSLYVGKKFYLAYNPDGFFLVINNPDKNDVTEELGIRLNHIKSIIDVCHLYLTLTGKKLNKVKA
jgi:hypothetical protein